MNRVRKLCGMLLLRRRGKGIAKVRPIVQGNRRNEHSHLTSNWTEISKKGKVKCTCIAPFNSRRSGMDHTGLPLQTTSYLPLPCERSPDGATWTADIWFSSLLIYQPQKDERVSWPSWLTYSGRYTHISGHTSAADWAEARESSPVRDRRSNHWAVRLTNTRDCMQTEDLQKPQKTCRNTIQIKNTQQQHTTT